MYNYRLAKQLSQLVPPLAVLISGNYATPKTPGDNAALRVVSRIVRDWQLGWLLRYQSGALLPVPSSTNQLENQLLRSGGFNGAPQNNDNRVPGVNPLAVDPNCHCFNPQTTVALNPAAWKDPGTGHWGASAPFFSNYRLAKAAFRGDEFRLKLPLR
jgi:hypothetical protein